jgi:hypothetical protein
MCLVGKCYNMGENSINQVFNVVWFARDCQEVKKQVLDLVCKGEDCSKINNRDETRPWLTNMQFRDAIRRPRDPLHNRQQHLYT